MRMKNMQAVREQEFTLHHDDFQRIVRLVKTHAGIVLTDRKRDLVYGRLAPRLRTLGINDFSQYCEILEGRDGDAECRLLVNAITTNLTGFFREAHHFEFLAQEALPGIVKSASSGRRRLRVWSAGCSSGEEPYSIAMTLRKVLPDLTRWDAKILATDIDTNMIRVGSEGCYERARGEAIPTEMRRQFVHETKSDRIEMADAVKSLISFKPLNLFDPWPMSGPFDVIFCRNVVIYFDKETQRILFDRFADMLTPNGWLFIGHSESLFQVCDRFRHVGRTIYKRVS
jgi:chemotaxis protein methyltransferase CheR